MSQGIRLTDKDSSATVTSLVGVRTDPTKKVTLIPVDDLSEQMLAGRIGDEINEKTAAAASGLKSAKTWPELFAVVGSVTLQKGEVITDAGTHTDPVVGGTVPNKGTYSWSTSPAGWKRTGDILDADLINGEIEAVSSVFKSTNSGRDIGTTTDRKGFAGLRVENTGGVKTRLFRIKKSDYPGFIITDRKGFGLGRFSMAGSKLIGLASGETAAPSDFDPYHAPTLFGWSGEQQKIYLERLFPNAGDADRCLLTILGATGHNDSGETCVTFMPDKLGATATLTARPRAFDGGNVAERTVNVIASPATLPDVAVRSPVILAIGDSNSQFVGQFMKPVLDAKLFTPTFVGTRSFGGVNVEGHSGWESGDLTHAVTTNATPVSNWSAYLALSNDDKNGFNPFLRPTIGGDPSGDVVNGYILDFLKYQTETAIPTPTIVPYGMSTNDVVRRTLDEIYTTTYTNDMLFYRRIHAAWPNAKIPRWIAIIPRTLQADALMPSYKAYLKGMMDAIRDYANPKVFLVSTWVASPADAGFDLTAGTTDPTTGVKRAVVSDYKHQKGGARLECFRILAAATAAAARNLI